MCLAVLSILRRARDAARDVMRVVRDQLLGVPVLPDVRTCVVDDSCVKDRTFYFMVLKF